MSLRPILYAEDDENDAYFFQRACQQAGIANPLVVATNGQEAIDYCSGNEGYANRSEHPLPCLLLVDLHMPKKTGLEVLDWARSQPFLRTIPIIILTSSLQDADIERAYQGGANAYLVKPSLPSEMGEMVKTIKDFWLGQNKSCVKDS